MKKTLLMAALCLGVAGTACAADYTISTNVTDLGKDHTGGNVGWTSSLTSDYMSTVEGLPQQVVLTTISLVNPTNKFSSGATVNLAIASLGENDSITFHGFTTQATTMTQGSTSTFTFDAITLDTSTQYYFLFMDSTVKASDLTSITTTAQLTASGYLESVRERIFGSIAEDSQDATQGLVNSSLGTVSTHIVNATYKVSDVPAAAIPEPATATLSLLALAGLAARRRRK